MNNKETKDVVMRIYDKACRFPDKPAICYQKKTYSYSDVWKMALCICDHLKKVSFEKIGIYSNGDHMAFVAMLGCMLAGKAFVVFNSDAPHSRNVSLCKLISLKYMFYTEGISLHDSYNSIDWINVSSLVSNYELLSIEPVQSVTKNSLLAIFFTSGSTGESKSVAISHANLNGYVDNFLQRFPLSSDDRVIQLTEINFDPILNDVFVTWSIGACLYVFPGNIFAGLGHFISKYKISVWMSVPTLGKILVKDNKNVLFDSLRWTFFGGESLSYEFCHEWNGLAPNSNIVNCYGPTEATVAVSSYTLYADTSLNWPRSGQCPIGKPYFDVEIKLTNEEPHEENDEACVDVTNECLIASSQVALGYLHNEKENNQRFINIGSKRWYKTGDMMSRDDHGCLKFLGRKDSQIKRRGYRIELLEVEQMLMSASQSTSVAVIAINDEINCIDSKKLIGFVSHSNVTLERIYKNLKSNFPRYLHPDRIVFLPELPRNSNGKSDYNKLKSFITELAD